MNIRKNLLGTVILASSICAASETVNATGTFSLTGSMNTSRQQHTATLLSDGSVIVIGGFDGINETNTAEIFEVGDGVWTTTGSMAYVRYYHTSTLLNNGKILIVGWDQSAELYDPNTRTFSSAGNTVTHLWYGSTATKLLDGRVLIVGGDGGNQSNAEIYDPATGTFSATGDLNTAHSFHTATLLSDGKVLIAAGQDQTGPQTHAIAEIYDPSTGIFTTTNSLNVDRSGHTATLLSDGTVLIAGGTQTTTPGYGIALKSAEIYNPSTGTFTLTTDMNNSRTGHTATLLSDGTVLLVGWLNNTTGEIYNPTSQTFTQTGAMNNPRGAHTATLLDNGKVLIAGGYIAIGPVTTNTAELYNPGPVVSNVSASGISGDITVTYDLIDANSDTCSITVEYQGGSVGTTWTTASIAGLVGGITPGSGRTITWKSRLDESGQSASDYKIKITPNDGTADGTPGESSTFSVNNTSISDDGGGGGGWCFIATAAYGTPMADEVVWLSRFRDEYLLKNNLGRQLVSYYYRYGPRCARTIYRKEWLKAFVRVELKPLVWMSKFLIKIKDTHKK